MSDSPRSRGDAVRSFLARRWLSILLVVLAAVFVLQNRQDVPVRLFATTVTSPLWVTLTVVLLVGVAAGSIRTRRGRR